MTARYEVLRYTVHAAGAALGAAAWSAMAWWLFGSDTALVAGLVFLTSYFWHLHRREQLGGGR